MAAGRVREMAQLRNEARTERQALRAEYAEQLSAAQRQADERVAAVTQALEMAREAARIYRMQPADVGPDDPGPSPGVHPRRPED